MARTSVATDAFTRADSGTLGANWTDSVPSYSDIDLTSNQAVGSSDIDEAAYWAGTGSFTNDQYAKATITQIGFQSSVFHQGVVVRGSGQNSTRTYYGFRMHQDSGGPNYTTELFKVINGTETVLVSAQKAWSVNDTIELEVVGTNLTGFRNGTAVTGFVNISDSSISTGKPGITLCRNASSVDSFEGGNVDSTQHITGTGALTCSNATASGSAVRRISGSGALTCSKATASGAGSKNSSGPQSVTGTGTLTAANATVTGSAKRGIHDQPGPIDLVASSPTVSGTGTVYTPVHLTGGGTLTVSKSTVAGSGTRTAASPSGQTGTGTLSARTPTVAGLGAVVQHVTGTGALVAPVAQVKGYQSNVQSGITRSRVEGSRVEGFRV